MRTDDEIAEAVRKTRQRAMALLEDLDWMEWMVGQLSPPRAAVKQLTSILRRLLITDSDLAAVARPRIGKIKLQVPDLDAIDRLWDEDAAWTRYPIAMQASGGVRIPGGPTLGPWVIAWGYQPIELAPTRSEAPATKTVTIDGFLSQRVIHFNGLPASRKTVIEFVAYNAESIHSGLPKSQVQLMLDQARRAFALKIDDPQDCGLVFFRDAFTSQDAEMPADPFHIDITLVEVLAAATFLLKSEDVVRLRAAIIAEIQPRRLPHARPT